MVFRDIGTSLRHAVDMKEDFLYAMLHLQEVCGFEGKVGVAECLGTMCSRAQESNLTLKITEQGEVGVLGGGERVWSSKVVVVVVVVVTQNLTNKNIDTQIGH